MRALVLGQLALALVACGSTGPYVPAAAVAKEDPTSSEYVISAGDVVSVRVFNQENMSTRARVRPDGRIAVPFLGDVNVAGQSPVRAAKDMELRFKDYIVSPTVTVVVEELRQTTVSVIGEVARPGILTLEPTAGVIEALAGAGGLTEFASKSHIYVLRRSPARRIRFEYRSLVRNEDGAADFRLRSGDVVVVE